MRFNLKNLLQGIIYSAPIVLLALSACGGGGGGSSGPTAPLPTYTVGGTVSGLTGNGLVIRDNGGDDLTIATGMASYTFATQITQGKSYNVTVLTYPTNPTQKCTVANSSSATIAANVTNANVTCSNSYTVGGTVNGLTGTGLVLQNNGGDNVLVAPSSNASYTFNTPLTSGEIYSVSVLTQPRNQTCTVTSPSAAMASAPVSVSISCVAASAALADPYVYVVNASSTGTGGVSVYSSATATGVLTVQPPATTANGPSAIAIDAGKFAYVANYNSNSLSAFSIASGVLSALPDVDAGTLGTQTSIATGTTPDAVVVHPSGKFVYVANHGSGTSAGSISAYSIDASGALSAIDADQAAGNQPTIATQNGPRALVIDPTGAYLYVANESSNTISAYSINPTTGALISIGTPLATGTTPYSIAMNPAGPYLYVANSGSSSDISAYTRNSTNGTLSPLSTGTVPVGINIGPHSIVVDPAGTYAYVVATNSTTNSQVWAYSIDAGGVLSTPAGTTYTFAAGISPYAITLDSTGSYAYVANRGSDDVSVFSVSNGQLVPITCSTPSSCTATGDFTAGAGPAAIATSR